MQPLLFLTLGVGEQSHHRGAYAAGEHWNAVLIRQLVGRRRGIARCYGERIRGGLHRQLQPAMLSHAVGQPLGGRDNRAGQRMVQRGGVVLGDGRSRRRIPAFEL